MSNEKFISLLKHGADYWNLWRKEHPEEEPNLRNVNFAQNFSGKDFYGLPVFYGANFTNTDLHMASLRNGTYCDCTFDGATMPFSDLVDALFQSCTFRNVNMRVCKIGDATFQNCLFKDSDLSYCSAENTSFQGSHFKNTKLEYMSLVGNDFSNTILENCFVYGISSWDLNLDNSVQHDLVITPDGSAVITVDNIELAQFLYLIVNNCKLRNVIDTITSKVVLILGNFSEERKRSLDNIKRELRKYDLIPVMFDFTKPESRNLTETVFTLASMSKFIVADLSSPRSIPHELANIAIRLPSVSFFPIIAEGEKEYGMFADYASYPWIKPIKEYTACDIDKVVYEIVQEATA